MYMREHDPNLTGMEQAAAHVDRLRHEADAREQERFRQLNPGFPIRKPTLAQRCKRFFMLSVVLFAGVSAYHLTQNGLPGWKAVVYFGIVVTVSEFAYTKIALLRYLVYVALSVSLLALISAIFVP